MGRFSLMRWMVDPQSVYVYETEDSNRCGFLHVRSQHRGQLQRRRAALHAEGSGGSRMSTWAMPRDRHLWSDQLGRNRRCDRVHHRVRTGIRQGRREFPPLEGAWWGARPSSCRRMAAFREWPIFEYDPAARALTILLFSDSAEARQSGPIKVPRARSCFCSRTRPVTTLRLAAVDRPDPEG